VVRRKIKTGVSLGDWKGKNSTLLRFSGDQSCNGSMKYKKKKKKKKNYRLSTLKSLRVGGLYYWGHEHGAKNKLAFCTGGIISIRKMGGT